MGGTRALLENVILRRNESYKKTRRLPLVGWTLRWAVIAHISGTISVRRIWTVRLFETLHLSAPVGYFGHDQLLNTVGKVSSGIFFITLRIFCCRMRQIAVFLCLQCVPCIAVPYVVLPPARDGEQTCRDRSYRGGRSGNKFNIIPMNEKQDRCNRSEDKRGALSPIALLVVLFLPIIISLDQAIAARQGDLMWGLLIVI